MQTAPTGIISRRSQKFCDGYSYEYAWLKGIDSKTAASAGNWINATQSYGQILTRMEDFLESVQKAGDEHKNQTRQN
ncbi:MAG: hypothetical protein V8R85_06765 [Frisingicoccus sp.]